MIKRFFLIGFMLLALTVKAHQSDVSTTMLVEKENGTWILQISASLTAFQHEIKTHFADTPYKTPEEFKEMVIEHMKKNIQFQFNEDQEIGLSKGLVVLGHETKVVFEVYGIPSEIHSVSVKNAAFSDIYKNKSALILLKEGFNKEHFVLNDDNNHTLALDVVDNKFVEINEAKASFFSYEMLLIVFAIFGVLFLIKNAFKEKDNAQESIDINK